MMLVMAKERAEIKATHSRHLERVCIIWLLIFSHNMLEGGSEKMKLVFIKIISFSRPTTTRLCNVSPICGG